MSAEPDEARDTLVPQLSVVLPVFNNLSGATRTLEALGRQVADRGDVEVIVVDDGSTDGSEPELRHAVSMLNRARLVSVPNRGPSAARNTGALAATGTRVAFLDANDVPLPGWLEAFADRTDGRVGIVHCDPGFEDEDIDTSYGYLLPGCFAIERSIFIAIGGYDETLRFAENSDLVERAHARAAEASRSVVHVRRRLLHVLDVSDPRRYDAPRVDAMIHLLARDREELARDATRRERYARIGAVSAVRSRRWRDARRLALTALRAGPTSARNWTRLALVLVPPLARRRWPGAA